MARGQRLRVYLQNLPRRALGGIQVAAKANGELMLARARATGTQALGEAKAAAEAAHVRAYQHLPPVTVLALALQELAGQLPQIGTLVLSPDLLQPVLARLGGAVQGGPVPGGTVPGPTVPGGARS